MDLASVYPALILGAQPGMAVLVRNKEEIDYRFPLQAPWGTCALGYLRARPFHLFFNYSRQGAGLCVFPLWFKDLCLCGQLGLKRQHAQLSCSASDLSAAAAVMFL